MGWFNRKPRDLIADSNAEWEQLRATEEQDHTIAQLVDVMSSNMRNASSHNAQVMPLIAAGGWCAPSTPPDYLQLPEIQIRRGGIKWPTNP